MLCCEHLESVSGCSWTVHLVAAKHVMRYLKGTVDYGLSYSGDHDFRLFGYSDSDWAKSVSDRKSTLGGCLSLGSRMIS